MQRIKIAPRPNWQARARELGFTFHSLDGETYWDESAYYAFSLAEMEREIEDPAQELEELCQDHLEGLSYMDRTSDFGKRNELVRRHGCEA